MFSTKAYLEKKTGPYGIGRLSYLQSLVVEYQDSSDLGKTGLYGIGRQSYLQSLVFEYQDSSG